MIDLLLEQGTFTISTPLGKREIVFSRDFEDREFDGFEYTDIYLGLKKEGKVLCKLYYDVGALRGADIRGGTTEIYPISNMQSKFDDFFKVDRPRELLVKPEKEVEVSSTFAVISVKNFEGYDCFKPGNDLFETYNNLFEKGYSFVLNINTNTTPHIIPLLANLAEKELKDGVGSVQVVSGKIGAPNEISIETGDWRSYAIDSMTWAKIKSKMNNRKWNFHRNLTLQFREKKLQRYSTNLSRDLSWTPQDSRRKNFRKITNSK